MRVTRNQLGIRTLTKKSFRAMREISPRGVELQVSDPALHVTGGLFGYAGATFDDGAGMCRWKDAVRHTARRHWKTRC
jgi:hypothetical protein